MQEQLISKSKIWSQLHFSWFSDDFSEIEDITSAESIYYAAYKSYANFIAQWPQETGFDPVSKLYSLLPSSTSGNKSGWTSNKFASSFQWLEQHFQWE